jgi:hypothetical protein
MAVDEVTVLREALAAHRAMLMGALSGNAELDIDRALLVHAGLARILARWGEYSAPEQRRIVATVEYLVNPDDGGRIGDDLHDPDGFLDDLAEFDRLQAELGYA